MGWVGRGRLVDAVYLVNIHFATDFYCDRRSISLARFCGYIQCVQADRDKKIIG